MMRLACSGLFLTSLAAMIASPSCAAFAAGLPLQPVADIALGGNSTRLDYASFDADRHVLFIAHLGDSAVVVFDTQARRIVTRIANVSKVHGVLAIPQLHRIYASATGTNEVVAIDENSWQITARVPAGVYPDGIAYAPDVRKLYVSDEHGKTETVIDVDRNVRIATIALGGEVGNSQYDPGSKHVFANVQTRGDLVEIDPATDKIVGRTPLPGAKGNHGLLIDSERRLAFVACEDNASLLVLDLNTRKIAASFRTGRDPDVLALDPGLGLVYVASESGIVALFGFEAGKVVKVGEAFAGPDAHVVAVDARTHDVYFPLMDLDGATALRIVRPGP
ncbi:MAG TPA: YncE family protein [Rhodanobacteraceae bacterium]|jgi:DNA-binding beta-propeller fold protein YncE|nr:YncE family protein [Rhodanobacteraceae bacterium]